MERNIHQQIQGFRTKDGAGVSLVRVLGHNTTLSYDPILMLDSFDSVNPDEYRAGFPLHPHRGIETISYVYRGKMTHRDSLGNEDTIRDGEVQWMTAGSGILHEEMLPDSERLLGVQLWLNLPEKDKMTTPAYKSIKKDEISEVSFEHGMLRVLAGKYKDTQGFVSTYLPLDFYDVHLRPGGTLVVDTAQERSVTLFTLLGDAYIAGELVEEKTAVKLTSGDSVNISAGDTPAQVLFISSKCLGEPIAWGGPIVMNTRDELEKAFQDLEHGTFLQKRFRIE